MQVSLEELMALASALESSSEHPLAGAVLDFAESIISPPEPHPSRTFSKGLDNSEVLPIELRSKGGETELLLMSPRSPKKRNSPSKSQRRTDWLRNSKDVEPKPGWSSHTKPLDQICSARLKTSIRASGSRCDLLKTVRSSFQA